MGWAIHFGRFFSQAPLVALLLGFFPSARVALHHRLFMLIDSTENASVLLYATQCERRQREREREREREKERERERKKERKRERKKVNDKERVGACVRLYFL
jgi:hypothetical protein